jgi:xylulokinase
MSETQAFLGLDIGTSAVKAGAFDGSGRRLAPPVSAPWHSLPAADPDVSEADPARWRQAASTALRQLLGGLGSARPAALGLSTLFPCALVMDEQGEALRPAILYNDLRSRPQVERLRACGLEARIRGTTGNPVMAGTCSLTSFLWVRENEPALFGKAAHLGHGCTYLGRWLTGQWGISPSSACLSGVCDPRTRAWSDSLCEALDMSAARLPPIVSSTSALGGLSARAAGELGLPTGLPVSIGAGDAVAAALGAGLTRPGQAFDAAGTTDTIELCLDEAASDPRLFLLCHGLEGLWLSVAAMTCTGASLDWFLQHLCGGAEAGTVLDEAEQVPAGARGVLFFPYLRGERSPHQDPALRGAFFGLSDSSGRAELARAVLEGVAFAMRQNLDLLEAVHGRRIEELTLGGGPTASAPWNQIRADVTRRRIVLLPEREASVRGAALLGALAAGGSLAAWMAGLESDRWPAFTPRDPSPYEQVYARWLAGSDFLAASSRAEAGC